MSTDGHLVGRHSRLEPLQPAHYGRVYEIVNRADISYRWRHRGRIIGPDEFESGLWPGAVAQFAAFKCGDTEPRGLVLTYNASHEHGFAYFAAAFEPEESLKRWNVEACFLLFDYTFSRFALRKLYAEVPAFNLTQFTSAVGKVLTEEGVLPRHLFFDGEYHALHILALYREHWLGIRKRYLGS
jgi:hypothetical protein